MPNYYTISVNASSTSPALKLSIYEITAVEKAGVTINVRLTCGAEYMITCSNTEAADGLELALVTAIDTARLRNEPIVIPEQPQ